ncbi:neurogenic differentiation factor 1-like [Pectinophora gossypiella]|uniref:MADF domain-containing protein n=1 Tax=Pectinophora gossypiella TaxID=13191 RepID=A0A1E1WA50_PECGO|nr:neurogenic differentiation factor 1-like [Pectinophora gossypiella]
MPLMDVSTGRVIKEVQMRPVLWDSSHDQYKNKYARLKAWKQVFCALIPEFLTLPAAEQKDTDRAIQQRWKTARDAYIRCKSQMKAGTLKKKYFYYDYLSFLQKNFGENPEQSPPSASYDPLAPSSSDTHTVMKLESMDDDSENEYNEPEEDDNDREHEPEDGSPQEDDDEEPPPEIRKPLKRKLTSNGVNKQILKMCKENSARMKNDNMSFFMSMLPIVNKFNDQQKLMFRSEVIRVAMEISSKKEEW